MKMKPIIKIENCSNLRFRNYGMSKCMSFVQLKPLQLKKQTKAYDI